MSAPALEFTEGEDSAASVNSVVNVSPLVAAMPRCVEIFLFGCGLAALGYSLANLAAAPRPRAQASPGGGEFGTLKGDAHHRHP